MLRTPKRHHGRKPRPSGLDGRLALCIPGALCLFLLMRHSETALGYMNRGLILCAKTVIPSLFPFMVLSELMVGAGCGELLGRLCERPMRRLFGITGAGSCALVMGLVCGFPIGAKTAVSLCRHGQISPRECSRLICFCNVPSPAFMVNVVGISLFGSRRFGLMLYGLCILTSLLIALMLHLLRPLDTEQSSRAPVSAPSSIRLLTHAITSSAVAMLYVCAYVVFFTALVGTLGQLLSEVGAGQGVLALLFGFFELSGGVAQAAAIPDANLARWVAALLCGWSGLSVHLQILSLCDDMPGTDAIRTAPYFLCKLLQGLLCALLCGMILYILPSARLSPIPPAEELLTPALSVQKILLICNVALLSVGLLALFRHRHKKKSALRTEG